MCLRVRPNAMHQAEPAQVSPVENSGSGTLGPAAMSLPAVYHEWHELCSVLGPEVT